jgi:hypothetical protein
MAEDREERDHLEDQVIDGRMGKEWILGRLAGVVWSGSSWLRLGAGGGFFVNTVMKLQVLAPRS